MEFGTSIFITDEMPSPGDIGRIIEERGFDSMFIAEHTHMPRDSVRDVDRKYYRALDPFVSLTAAAATLSSRASTTSRAAGSRSASARAGTCPRSRTMARASRSASA